MLKCWKGQKDLTYEIPTTADVSSYVGNDDRVVVSVTDADGDTIELRLPASLAKLMHALIGVSLVRHEDWMRETN